MVSVSDDIQIDASRRAVFEFLDDPHHHVEVTPSLVSVSDIEPLDNGGKRATFIYSIGGVKLEGDLVETTHRPDQQMIFELRGALSGEIDLQFEDGDSGTHVTYAASYDIPGKVLSRLAEPFVRRYNRREVETLLANLKTRLEVSPDS
jgi:carbon monoxide dehydrogenase subunit G